MIKDGIGLNEIRSDEISWDRLISNEIGFDWIRCDEIRSEYGIGSDKNI